MSFSIQEFLQESNLSKKLNAGSLENSPGNGLGEFIAIYDGDERYSRNTVVSSELVQNHGIDKFDWVTFDSRSGLVYAFFFTEDCRQRKNISKNKSISLHDKHDSGFEQAFHGNVPLRDFDLEPPVRFAVGKTSYVGEGSLILALYRVPFIPFQHVSVQAEEDYFSRV